MTQKSTDILVDWTDEHTAKFQKDILTVRHRLSETGLFSDEALAQMLDKHPKEKLDVCTMHTDHPLYPNQFRTGDFRDVDGATLIKAAKAGAIWVNARQAMNVHPEYNAVLKRMYGSISEVTGRPSFNARGGILISSPVAKVPFHCDKTETILWHVRGKKRIYIYPLTEEFLADESYQNIIANDLGDDLPYKAEMDKSARYFDLEPDQMISWQLNAPHRVDNQSYCVSVTTEYSTKASAFKNSVMYTDALLRKKFGVQAKWSDASNGQRLIKSAAGRVLRKAGAIKVDDVKDMVTFKIDETAKSYVVDVEPFVRNF